VPCAVFYPHLSSGRIVEEKKRRKEKQEERRENMELNLTESANEWAVRTYGCVKLAHEGRTKRAVKIASALARDPMGSFPKQLGNQAATKATYRFLESAHTSYEHLMAPHLEQTKAMMQQQKRILLIQDGTEIDYTHHPKTRELGPVGKGNRHQGYLLQTVLAVEPMTRQVLGIAAQEAFVRQSAPVGETSHERDKRTGKESEVWGRQARQVGTPPPGTDYLHVGDRGSDIFAFLQECLKLNCGFEVRVKHDRRVDVRVDQAERPVSSGARRSGTQRPAGQAPPGICSRW
jgi:hypothetical protein